MNLSNFIVEFFSTTLETGLVFLVYSYTLRCKRPKRDTAIAFLLFYIVFGNKEKSVHCMFLFQKGKDYQPMS